MGNSTGGREQVTDRPLTDYENRIVANVQEFGCEVVSVFDPKEVEPDFSYSIGFWETVQQPEVIILGLPSQMGKFAINETLRQCQSGLELFDWQRIEGLFEKFDVTCVARSVDPKRLVPEYFNSAIWYHDFRTGQPLSEAFQLVWSYEGLYPWDKDAPTELLDDQPLLYSASLN